jgi:hypothetical protein
MWGREGGSSRSACNDGAAAAPMPEGEEGRGDGGLAESPRLEGSIARGASTDVSSRGDDV